MAILNKIINARASVLSPVTMVTTIQQQRITKRWHIPLKTFVGISGVMAIPIFPHARRTLISGRPSLPVRRTF